MPQARNPCSPSLGNGGDQNGDQNGDQHDGCSHKERERDRRTHHDPLSFRREASAKRARVVGGQQPNCAAQRHMPTMPWNIARDIRGNDGHRPRRLEPPLPNREAGAPNALGTRGNPGGGRYFSSGQRCSASSPTSQPRRLRKTAHPALEGFSARSRGRPKRPSCGRGDHAVVARPWRRVVIGD